MKTKQDYPKFMKYTHKITVTKNGKERSYDEIRKDRNRVERRIDKDMVCPMNWMQENLEKIQGMRINDCENILDYLTDKPEKDPTRKQMAKIRKIIEDYDAFIRRNTDNKDINNEEDESETIDVLESKADQVYNIVSKMKISLPTMYRLISSSLGYEGHTRNDRKYKKISKYTVRTLNVLYNSNQSLFLSCFTNEKDS